MQEKQKIEDYDREFLWRQLEKESQNSYYWHQKFKAAERELAQIKAAIFDIYMSLNTTES